MNNNFSKHLFGYPVLIFLLFSTMSYCQYPQWQNYTSGNRVSAMAVEDNYVWAGTGLGCIARIDKTTGTVIFYNHTNSGLPADYVVSIAIDKDGNKWIGTDGGGLVKFDGNTWTVYNTVNSGLPYNNVSLITIDSNSNKWFVASGKLVEFDNSTWTVYDTTNSGLPSNDVSSIAIDNNGNKWIGTKKDGLAKFDGTTWTVYDTSNSGLPCNVVNSIAIDTNGSKWICTDYITTYKRDSLGIRIRDSLGFPIIIIASIVGGLTKYDDATWTVYDTTNSGLPRYSQVSSIAIDDNGYKWIGTRGNGIVKYDGTAWTVYDTTNSGLPPNYININSITIDHSGNKWICSYNSGLAKFDGTTCTVYRVANSGLPNNMITSIAIDNNGNKWIEVSTSYPNSRLTKYDGTVWTNYSKSDIRNVSSIAIDNKGNKWLGSYDYGLFKFDDTTLTYYNESNLGLPSNYCVNSIAIDAMDNKWIGTNRGLAKFDGTGWTIYYPKNSGLPDNQIRSIAIDNNDSKWIGTYSGGLAKFDGTTWTVYDTINSGLLGNHVCGNHPCYNAIDKIVIDKSGCKWMSAFPTLGGYEDGFIIGGKGLIKFDGTTWTVYDTTNSGLPDNNITSIAIDNNGNKWIGTYYGLVKFDGATWTVYDRSNSGLPDNYVTSIAIDNNGNKWIGTYGHGLACFNENGFTSTEAPDVSLRHTHQILENTPNPFNPETNIRFTLSSKSLVTMRIYDAKGRLVKTLLNGLKSSGTHEVLWNGLNSQGKRVPSGIYICRLVNGTKVYTKALVLAK